jgi:hypothetical protein
VSIFFRHAQTSGPILAYAMPMPLEGGSPRRTGSPRLSGYDSPTPASPVHHTPSTNRTRSMRTTTLERGLSAAPPSAAPPSTAKRGPSVSRLNLVRATSEGDHLKPSPFNAATPSKPRPTARVAEVNLCFRPPPVHNCYTKEDPALVGALKGDILTVRGRIDDLRTKSDSEASDLIRTIAKYIASEDHQAESDARLFLLETRDNQMCQLEALVAEKVCSVWQESPRGPRTGFASPRQCPSRLAPYMFIIDLLLGLSTQHQELRQFARDRDWCVQSMDSQLRALLAAVEAQNAQLQAVQKAAQSERDRLEAAHWAACVERDAAKESNQQLCQTVASLESANQELTRELSYFQKEHDRLQRECSFLGEEMEVLSKPEPPTFQRYMSVKMEFCDRCATTNALVNSLKQERQEQEYILQKMRQERDKTWKQFREAEKTLETEKEQRAQLQCDVTNLSHRHRVVLSSLDRQDTLLSHLRSQITDLFCVQVLQAEAGERLALMAHEEADTVALLWNVWCGHASPPQATGVPSRPVDQQELGLLRSEVRSALGRATALSEVLQQAAPALPSSPSASASSSRDPVSAANALQGQLAAVLKRLDPKLNSPNSHPFCTENDRST